MATCNERLNGSTKGTYANQKIMGENLQMAPVARPNFPSPPGEIDRVYDF